MRRIKWLLKHLGGGMFFPLPFSQCRSSQLQSQAGIAMRTNEKESCSEHVLENIQKLKNLKVLKTCLLILDLDYLLWFPETWPRKSCGLAVQFQIHSKDHKAYVTCQCQIAATILLGFFAPCPLGWAACSLSDLTSFGSLFFDAFWFWGCFHTSSGFLMAGVIKRVKGKKTRRRISRKPKVTC